jgi:NAD(P)-dependent dehydrogenase (short-subunit alcohol dehydrogenase family)
MKALEGKVAVITGGSSGIGLATAKLFRDEGAKVAISGRNQKSLDDAIKELGAGVVAVRSDVSKLSDLDTLFNVVAKKLGRIDVLFANAGIAKFAPVSDVSENTFEETFDINVKGVFFTIKQECRRQASILPARQQCAHWLEAFRPNSQAEESG